MSKNRNLSGIILLFVILITGVLFISSCKIQEQHFITSVEAGNNISKNENIFCRHGIGKK